MEICLMFFFWGRSLDHALHPRLEPLAGAHRVGRPRRGVRYSGSTVRSTRRAYRAHDRDRSSRDLDGQRISLGDANEASVRGHFVADRGLLDRQCDRRVLRRPKQLLLDIPAATKPTCFNLPEGMTRLIVEVEELLHPATIRA